MDEERYAGVDKRLVGKEADNGAGNDRRMEIDKKLERNERGKDSLRL